MDWRLGIFRFGLLACVVWVVVVATQFDIVDSVVAIWNHNPTAYVAGLSVTVAAKRQSACLSAHAQAPSTEFPSSCYYNDPTFRGLPGDEAVANLKGFLITVSLLPFLLIGVVSLGLRMAIAGRID